ncbi:MAG TPA: DUF4142 domain-containing protein [Bacteroidales bacterium]|nr:DUF4142 domain-containing protein [Bacteroidales bacterium]
MRTIPGTRNVLLAVLVMAVAGISACKDDKNDEPDLASQDQTFSTAAAASNLAEIRFGQLALSKSTNDSILIFAGTMVTEHTKANKQLDSLAKRLNVSLPDSMDAAHITLYNKLSGMTNNAFDSAYIQSQVMDHQAAQTLMQTQISNGKNMDLVEYANKNLPAINMHLQQALNLRTYINSSQQRP